MPTPPFAAHARVARAASLGAFGTGLAVAAHLAGGECVALGPVALLLGLQYAAALGPLARTRSTGWFLAWLVAAQGLSHAYLTLTCGDHQGALHQHLVAPGGTAALAATHLLAVLATATAFGRADLAVRLRAGVRQWLSRWLAPVHHAGPALPRAVPVRRAAFRTRATWRAPHPVRRGPPASSYA